jgi:hypothetical protein
VVHEVVGEAQLSFGGVIERGDKHWVGAAVPTNELAFECAR